MTINSLEDLFKGAVFKYYYTKNNKIINHKDSLFLTHFGHDIIKGILDNGNCVYEWWIELDPKVIEEVNREFDLSK